jgi:hypothetical protein
MVLVATMLVARTGRDRGNETYGGLFSPGARFSPQRTDTDATVVHEPRHMRPGLSRSGLGRAGLTESADSDQQLDALLVCVECGAEADEDAQGWRMYRADVPQQGDNEPELAALLPRVRGARVRNRREPGGESLVTPRQGSQAVSPRPPRAPASVQRRWMAIGDAIT